MGFFDNKSKPQSPYRFGTGGLKPGQQDARIPESQVEEGMETQYIPLISSRCSGCQYFPLTQQLEIHWKDGNKGVYADISPDEFRTFLQASSKGIFIQDHFIGRGKKRGEPGIKPYSPL